LWREKQMPKVDKEQMPEKEEKEKGEEEKGEEEMNKSNAEVEVCKYRKH
jgi:hypothetical protein